MPRRAAVGMRRAWHLATLAPLLAAACITTYESIDPKEQALRESAKAELYRVTQAIPFGRIDDGVDPVLRSFFDGIVRQLQDAADTGDWRQIDALVDAHDRVDLPDSIAEQLRDYRGVARGVAFEQHLMKTAVLAPVAADDGRRVVLGEPMRFELRVPAPPDAVLLGGRDDEDPLGFTVSLTIEDEYVDGGSRSSQAQSFLWLPQTFDLRGDAELTLPVDVAAAAGEAVRRTVYLRVDLMQGWVRVAGRRAPVRRTTLAAGSWDQWPEGYEILAAEPLRALKSALNPFSREHFAAAYLAATAAPPAQRDEVVALLMDQVRYGNVAQAQVAMAALHKVTGAGLQVGDRDAWLSWHQRRR